MFSTKLSRVAHRATPAVALTNPTSTASAAPRPTAPCIAARQPHQRRHSSSKASCPPDSDPKPTSAPAAKDSATARNGTKGRVSDAVKHRSRKSMSQAKPARVTSISRPVDRFAGLPAVPSIGHMASSDISTSSFFSLHRPLSLATTIPPTASAEAFSSIFEPRAQLDPWHNGNSAERRPEDVVYALQTTVDILENEANGAQRWELVSDSADGVKHLDGVPRQKSFDELVSQFKPFSAPPPPQAFPEEPKAVEKKKAGMNKQLRQRLNKQLRQQSYSTTIIVTESTSEDGQRTYTAQSTPIVRIPDSESQAAMEEPLSQAVKTRYRFAERMKQRQQASLSQQRKEIVDPTNAPSFVRRSPFARKRKMLLISVKRQRKLKMKKHKYKKLMKRTRNLRRRQDRA